MATVLHWSSVEWGLENISASELVEWQAYFSIYPLPDTREDYHAGLIASSIYNVNRGKSSDKVFNPTDFMPDFLKVEDIKPKLEIQPTNNEDFQHKLVIFKSLVS